ncbi:MAG: hypothetical protein QXX38_00955 [Candidatus Aenigmatarchaeota archaeon]
MRYNKKEREIINKFGYEKIVEMVYKTLKELCGTNRKYYTATEISEILKRNGIEINPFNVGRILKKLPVEKNDNGWRVV